jgi:hypothetical protein
LNESDYISDQHKRARIKVAGTWAEAARAYFEINARLQRWVQEPEDRDDDAEDGRDATGRLGYRLMTGSGGDLFTGLTGGPDIKEGERVQSGIKGLSLALADIFSTAACHKDAEQMMDLMAGPLLLKGTAQLVRDGHENQLLEVISLAVNQMPGSSKVLKLTNFQHHSVVFLISGQEDDATANRYHTIAGKNAKHILYNEIINDSITPGEFREALRSGISRASNFHILGMTDLHWELYQATNMEVMSERVDAHLSESASALGMGLLIDGLDERRKNDFLSSGHSNESTSGEIGPDFVARLPFKEIDTQAHLKIYELESQNLVTSNDLEKKSYRLHYRGRWMEATYGGPTEDVPSYMKPCAIFYIKSVAQNLELPKLPPVMSSALGVKSESKRLADFARETGRNFNTTEDLSGRKFVGETDGKTYTVLSDPDSPKTERLITVHVQE